MKNKRIRQMDEVGRIVLPKDIRTALSLRVGDAVEIDVERSSVILRKAEAVDLSGADGRVLSEEGHKLLNDPMLYEVLSVEAGSVGVSPEEYLLRFEEALSSEAEAVFHIFET